MKLLIKSLASFVFIFAMLSCQSADNGLSFNGKKAFDTTKSNITAQILDTTLKNPWGMAWLPDGRMLVTERAGEILIFKGDKNTGEKLSGVPEVVNKGQGGLMDIALHPDYAQNGWIYITYSKPMGGENSATAVMRFKLNGNQLTDKQDIFVAKPAIPANFHFGSRVAFDKNKYLFVTVGERGTQPKVWELSNDHGKVHRIFDDGRIPTDNPFYKNDTASKSIWTIGHRNQQGMAYDAATNYLWTIEHGPKGGDELNLIEPGKNYGWPKTSYGINYDGTVLTPYKEMDGVTNPVHYWVPSIGPCGMMQVKGDKYPGWKGNLLIGALAFKHIARVTLDGKKYVSEEKLLQDIGRVRHVAEAPDGFIYAVTEGPGQLVKLIPGK